MRWLDAHDGRSHGFTLVELVISSALLTVLLLAGAATASLVRRAGLSSVGESTLSLATAMHELRRDIESATSVGVSNSRGVAVVVPDRNGDSIAETIAYSWAGFAGAPLVRRVNGGTSATLVKSMQEFTVDADTTTITVASADQSLAPSSQTVASCLTSSSLNAIQCNTTRWVAVSFPPTLPDGTTSWTLNSVRLSLRRNGTADSTFAVQIRTTNGLVPTSTVLGSVTVSESSLGTGFATHEYTFTGITGLSPTAPIAIVLQPVSGTNVAQWQFTSSGEAVNPADAMHQSTNGGTSWTQLSGQEPLFSVTGTPSASAPQTEAIDVIRFVRVSAEAARGVHSAFEVEARGFLSATSVPVVGEATSR